MITAPFEADAQLAYLCKSGYVDAVVTEDSDLLLFGAPKILFKMGAEYTAKLVHLEDIYEVTRTHAD